MCHALVRIAYHHDKARDIVEVEKIEDFDRRLREIMDRPGVSRVTIFYPHTTHEEVKRWETRTHQQEKVNEEVNENSMVASIAPYQEVSAQDGSGDAAFPTIC